MTRVTCQHRWQERSDRLQHHNLSSLFVRQFRIQILHLLCAAFNKPFHFMLCDYTEYTHTDVRLQQLNIYSFHLDFIRTTYI